MKLIIFDADETLWFGDIFNNTKVELKPETKEVLRQLEKCKIKLAVCSRNYEPKLIEMLDKFKISQYFDWVYGSLDKSKDVMIGEMLELFKISPLDTLFIDDQPINRDLVKSNVGCHVDYFDDLYEVFKYIDTDRLKIMVQQRGRELDENRFKGTLKDFIKLSNFEVDIRPAEDKDTDRIVDLTMRTNHLNATNERFNKNRIIEFINHPGYAVLVASAKDKYGDYGVIGEVILEGSKEGWIILDLCVSCRVMNRGVGELILNHIKTNSLPLLRNFDSHIPIIGKIKETNNNQQMLRLFEKVGFVFYKEEEGIKYYTF